MYICQCSLASHALLSGKTRDVSHFYRQWKVIALLWLPSNRSESFDPLLIFPVSTCIPLNPRDCAIIKNYSKEFMSLTRIIIAFIAFHGYHCCTI